MAKWTKVVFLQKKNKKRENFINYLATPVEIYLSLYSVLSAACCP